MKKSKLILGIIAFAKTAVMLGIIVYLSIKKKSIPQALIAIAGVTGIASALLLISYDKDVKDYKKMKRLNAFYDYDSDYYDEELEEE